MRIPVAIVQAEPGGAPAEALPRLRAHVAAAAAAGARIVVFPESWIPGYPAWLDVSRDAALWDHAPVKAVYCRFAEAALVVPGPDADAIGAVARAHECTLVVGAVERVAAGPGRGTLYNTLLTWGPDGRLLNHHRKLVPTYTERLVWGAGDAAGVRAVDTPAGRVGGLICWEHWMPLARQALHESGEDVHVAAWPTVREMSLVASRHYAFEGRCFVLAAGGLLRARDLPPELPPHPDRVSAPDGWVLRGGSAIIGPDGGLLAGPVYDEPTILHAELDTAAIQAESMTLDVTGHYHRPDCLRLVRADVDRAAGA
jgi:nitrilase